MKKIAILLGFCMVVAFLPTFMPQPTYAMTGSGTAGDPYVIYNVTDLQNMQSSLNAYYVLNNSIDASSTATWNWNAGRGVYEGFAPVGTFTGHLDGHNYTITGLYEDRYVAGTGTVGLFSVLSSGATVQNLYLEAVDITGYGYGANAGEHGGALVGGTYACAISNVVVTGTVQITGKDTTYIGAAANAGGGLAGFIRTGTTISQCAAYVDVSCYHDTGYGYDNAGGLVGCWEHLSGTSYINNSYARGDAYADGGGSGGGCGGLVGFQRSTTSGSSIDNCYSTGTSTGMQTNGGLIGVAYSYPSVTDSFWDTQTSGRGSSAGGTGKTTPEMKTESTFTDAGWDFDTIWGIGGYINDGYPYFEWWYNPPDIIADVNQVVWFQPNTIIEGSILPNRAQSGTLQDGEFTWGANPAGITISHGELIPEEEYDFEPVIPGGTDIINPEPETMTGDVDTERLHNNPLYPFVQVLSIAGFLNERLVWLGLAWFILIAAMFGVHLGFDTHRDSEKPQHFILTTITGLGLAILFYTMGIFPWWVILLMAFGLVGAIIWERQPVL